MGKTDFQWVHPRPLDSVAELNGYMYHIHCVYKQGWNEKWTITICRIGESDPVFHDWFSNEGSCFGRAIWWAEHHKA